MSPKSRTSYPVTKSLSLTLVFRGASGVGEGRFFSQDPWTQVVPRGDEKWKVPEVGVRDGSRSPYSVSSTGLVKGPEAKRAPENLVVGRRDQGEWGFGSCEAPDRDPRNL